jgi:hypothetical protein
MTTIKLKNGSGAPTAGDLAQGEPALDLTNKRLYTEDSGGTVIEVGTNPGTDVTFADNRKAIFGAGSDLQIYHSGSASFIDDAGSGDLNLRAFNDLNIKNINNDNIAVRVRLLDGSEYVELHHAGNTKLATTSTGIDVTGNVDASLDLLVGGAVAGNAGTRTINVGTAGSVAGGVQIWAGTTQTSFLQFGDDSTTSANHYRGYLSYNHSTDTLALGASGSTKVSVTSTGIDVTGSISADGLTVEQSTTDALVNFKNTNASTSTQTSSGLALYHNGGSGYAQIVSKEIDVSDNFADLQFYYAGGTGGAP